MPTHVKMVEVWRGKTVESLHMGVAAIANSRGEIIESWGDINESFFPRSALKPIQAIALVETGAYASSRLGLRHLALACGSHNAEPFHTELALEWLMRLGLSQDSLACGPDLPCNENRVPHLFHMAIWRQKINHNCSGKHLGFLTVSKHCDWPLDGYADIDHPAQKLYLDSLSDLATMDSRLLNFSVDGCCLPAPALPIGDFAKMMARFSAQQAGSPKRRAAIGLIHQAMLQHPEYLSGTNQPNVILGRVTQGRIIMKIGAEGFLTAFMPKQGIAVALKIIDGTARGRVPALIAILLKAGLISMDEHKQLSALATPTVTNSVGTVVGHLQPCL
jgi:L-asparaginase II